MRTAFGKRRTLPMTARARLGKFSDAIPRSLVLYFLGNRKSSIHKRVMRPQFFLSEITTPGRCKMGGMVSSPKKKKKKMKELDRKLLLYPLPGSLPCCIMSSALLLKV